MAWPHYARHYCFAGFIHNPFFYIIYSIVKYLSTTPPHHIMDAVSTPTGPDTPISLLLSPAPSSASTLPLNSSINGATGVAVDVSPPITSRLHQTNTPSTLDSVIKHRRSELRRLQKIRAAKDEQTGGVHALIARGEDRTKPHSGSNTSITLVHTRTHRKHYEKRY